MTTPIIENKVHSFAALKNVALLSGLVAELQSMSIHEDRMGVFFGLSGWGKSRACRYARTKYRAVYVEVRDTWTRKYLLRSILIEMGVNNPTGPMAAMEDHVIQLLGQEMDRPLIIDEADKLVDRGMIELIRSIYDASKAPVVLVGEEALPAKLSRTERVARRSETRVAAQPCDLSDTKKLAAAFYPSLSIDDALLERLRAETQGNAARIIRNLKQFSEWARNAGRRDVTVAAYEPPLITGALPVPRSSAGSIVPLRRKAS